MATHCRICDGGEEEGELLHPCNCRASIHAACLEKWISIRPFPERDGGHIDPLYVCEVCQEEYRVKWVLDPPYTEDFFGNRARAALVGLLGTSLLSLIVVVVIGYVFLPMAAESDSNAAIGAVFIVISLAAAIFAIHGSWRRLYIHASRPRLSSSETPRGHERIAERML